MATKYAPDTGVPPLETRPQRSGGWFRRLQNRVKLAMAGNDDELLIENRTQVAWRVYHDYHLLGILDAGESHLYRLHKHGSLNARPYAKEGEVEYLVLPLTMRVHRVSIYRRHLGQAVEVYDLRVA